jgi:hypothetical protein
MAKQAGNKQQKENYTDLQDSARDKERLQQEEVTLDLPDVADIPGQENVEIPPPHSLGDATIASADEEGYGIFNDDNIVNENDSDISRDEKELLKKAATAMPTTDEERLYNAAIDGRDFEGDRINEESLERDRTGEDLDVPGDVDTTNTAAIAKDDEENSRYSLGSDDNDNVVEGTP